jgi:hypothetical protein
MVCVVAFFKGVAMQKRMFLGAVVLPLGELIAAASAPTAKPFASAQSVLKDPWKGLKKDEDVVQQLTFFRHPNSPEKPGRTALFFYCVAAKSGRPSLRLVAQFSSPKWLFVQTATVLADGKVIAQLSGRWERDHNGGKVFEWLDFSIDGKQKTATAAMVAAKTIMVRFDGRQYRHDHTLSASDLRALQQVHAAFLAAGGVLT